MQRRAERSRQLGCLAIAGLVILLSLTVIMERAGIFPGRGGTGDRPRPPATSEAVSVGLLAEYAAQTATAAAIPIKITVDLIMPPGVSSGGFWWSVQDGEPSNQQSVDVTKPYIPLLVQKGWSGYIVVKLDCCGEVQTDPVSNLQTDTTFKVAPVVSIPPTVVIATERAVPTDSPT